MAPRGGDREYDAGGLGAQPRPHSRVTRQQVTRFPSPVPRVEAVDQSCSICSICRDGTLRWPSNWQSHLSPGHPALPPGDERSPAGPTPVAATADEYRGLTLLTVFPGSEHTRVMPWLGRRTS